MHPEARAGGDVVALICSAAVRQDGPEVTVWVAVPVAVARVIALGRARVCAALVIAAHVVPDLVAERKVSRGA